MLLKAEDNCWGLEPITLSIQVPIQNEIMYDVSFPYSHTVILVMLMVPFPNVLVLGNIVRTFCVWLVMSPTYWPRPATMVTCCCGTSTARDVLADSMLVAGRPECHAQYLGELNTLFS